MTIAPAQRQCTRKSTSLFAWTPPTAVMVLVLFFTVGITDGVPAEISPEMVLAARDGDVDAVKKLLSKGEDVNAANADGVTALMSAAAGNRLPVLKALIEAGADTRRQTKSGKTAMFFAAARGNIDVVKLLEDVVPAQPESSVLRDLTNRAEVPRAETVKDGVGRSCEESALREIRFALGNPDLYTSVMITVDQKLRVELVGPSRIGSISVLLRNADGSFEPGRYSDGFYLCLGNHEYVTDVRESGRAGSCSARLSPPEIPRPDEFLPWLTTYKLQITWDGGRLDRCLLRIFP